VAPTFSRAREKARKAAYPKYKTKFSRKSSKRNSVCPKISSQFAIAGMGIGFGNGGG